MARGDTPVDELLISAWGDFCDRLKEAGEIIFRETSPATPLDRAIGFRSLSRAIPLALDFEVEYADPLHPALMRFFTPTRKQGGDNPDALYLGASIDGSETYRIHGQRGSAHYVAFTAMRPMPGPWGLDVVSTLVGDALEVAADGSFSLTLGPHETAGNWLRTTPDCHRITIRQFFADWAQEEPMQLRIERLGDPVPPPVLEPQALADALRRAGSWVGDATAYWADRMDVWQAQPNRFIGWRVVEGPDKTDATPGGVPLLCSWQIRRDEVLLIRVTPPPDASFWNVEFGNYRFESMDYRYTFSSINCHQAVLEDDGSLLLVVAQEDPGVPNWLDAAGHLEGYIVLRWMQAARHPEPECRVVPVVELESALPAGVRRIDAAGRLLQLRERQRGVDRRFTG